MDPLSIAASVVALFSAGEAAYKIASSLYHSSRKVKGAGDDIEIFAKDVDNFGLAMGTAYTALEPICSTNRPSRVIDYLIRNRGLESIAEQSKRLTRHIRKYNPDIRALRGRSKFIAHFKWAFQRKEINALGLRMESIKSNLKIIMNSITLEAILEQPHTNAKDKRMIKLLNRQITVHVRTIEMLQEQLEKHPLHPSLETGHHRALVDLGLSMVDNGTVPSPLPSLASSSSSIISMRSQPNINDQRHPSTPLHYSTTSVSTSPSQGFSSTSFEHQDLHSVDNRQQSQARHHSTTAKSVLGPTRESLRPQQLMSQSMEITRKSKPLDTTSENRPCPTDIEIDTTVSQHSISAQGDFIGVYENSYVLNLNPSHQLLAESGYIITPTGPVTTAALIDPDFGDNLISQSYAIRLGLEIEELDANEEYSDEAWIDFGEGQRQRAVGKLRLEWSDGLLPSRVLFSVHCWVFEHNVRNVVFGKPFIRKRNHYRHRGSN